MENVTRKWVALLDFEHHDSAAMQTYPSFADLQCSNHMNMHKLFREKLNISQRQRQLETLKHHRAAAIRHAKVSPQRLHLDPLTTQSQHCPPTQITAFSQHDSQKDRSQIHF